MDRDELNQNKPSQRHKQRIGWFMGWSLIVVAVCVDLLELILTYFSLGFGSFILGIAAAALFGIWFSVIGVPYSGNTKTFVTAIFMNLGEVLPILDAQPWWFLWTLGMVIIIGMVKMEDKGEKPSLIGGMLEGFAFTTSSNPLNPVAIPVGIAAQAALKAKRFAKRRFNVGQANWVKQEKQEKKEAEKRPPEEKSVQGDIIKQAPTPIRSTQSPNNTLDLRKNVPLKKAA